MEALAPLGVDIVETHNSSRRPPAGGGWGSVVNLAADRWWTAVELPRRARETNADVVHHPLPAHARGIPCPQVITVHDLAFERLPDHFDPRFRRYAHHAHRAAARRAGAVVAVSQTTALDAMALWGVPERRIVVACHGPGQDLGRRRRAREPRCFLYVGDDEPRKNLDLLLAGHRLYWEAAGQAALPLVLAGSCAGRAESRPGVEGRPLPSRDEIERLYADAAALVHPSLYEGFGLTPLEAMAAGTPVIAARSPGIVEVCADAVLYVDPHDPAELAAHLAHVAAERELRRELTERGRRRASAFSWEKSARAHVRAYTLALEGGWR
jgi:glycosyltransferase involved in cell wall biosynthesis